MTRGGVYFIFTTLRDSNGTQSVSIDSILTSQRIIFIDDIIEDKMAISVTKKILFFSIFDSDKPIKMLISSAGGSINSGFIIFDCMRSSNLHIETYCIGKALSMASLLCAAGHKRYILPNSYMLLHEPFYHNEIKAGVSAFEAAAKNMLKIKANFDNILSELTHQPLKTIESFTQSDHLFYAEDAVKFGLVDEICGIDKIAEGLHYDAF